MTRALMAATLLAAAALPSLPAAADNRLVERLYNADWVVRVEGRANVQSTIQFHGDETAQDCLDATGGGARAYLRAARIPLGNAAVQFDLVKYAQTYQGAQAILLDAHVDGYGGGGRTFNWSLLPPSVNCHLVLSGGLTPANVTDGILQVRPRCKTLAVDVSSGVEMSKGIKDADKIHQFVAAVRAADAQLARDPHDNLPAA